MRTAKKMYMFFLLSNNSANPKKIGNSLARQLPRISSSLKKLDILCPKSQLYGQPIKFEPEKNCNKPSRIRITKQALKTTKKYFKTLGFLSIVYQIA